MRAAALSFFAAAFVSLSASADDDDLKPLAEALAHARTVAGVNETHDAGPELTPVKQALRAWVESHLSAAPDSGNSAQDDLVALGVHLNEKLVAAGLTCTDATTAKSRCQKDDWEFQGRGYVGDVAVSALDYGRYVLAVTGVGIHCGYDQSAYIYQRGPDRKWKLLFQSEQDRYGKDEYIPQNFLTVAVSPNTVAWNEPAPPPLVLTLGFSPWCSSNWNVLLKRLWRASERTTTPKALMDKEESLYTGVDSIASARFGENDLVIEFEGHSIDGAGLTRRHIEHFLIGPKDELKRIAPVAISPKDFVEEWVSSEWSESVKWVDARGDKAALAKAHIDLAKRSGGSFLGDFAESPTRCRSDRTLWQINVEPDTLPEGNEIQPSNYFLVRWMAPYRFSMARIQQHPFPNCDEVVDLRDDLGGPLIQPDGYLRR